MYRAREFKDQTLKRIRTLQYSDFIEEEVGSNIRAQHFQI